MKVSSSLHVFFLNVFPFLCDLRLYPCMSVLSLSAACFVIRIPRCNAPFLVPAKNNFVSNFFEKARRHLGRGWIQKFETNNGLRRIIRLQNPSEKTDKQTDKIRRINRLNGPYSY